MLATIKALQGIYVDIVSSSSILAARDAEEFKLFYEIFILKVKTNEG